VSLFWIFVDYSLANIATNIMSKLINLFTESDKLDGPNNYKSWSRHMQNMLIYNELWRDIGDGDIAPTKPTDATYLAKWNLKVEKKLTLLRSFVTERMFVHIENYKDAWSAWNLLKKFFDTLDASQRVDLQMKLLKQRLADNGDVLEYISKIKNIHQGVRQHRYSNRGRTPSVTTHITRSKINTPMFSRGKTPTGKHPWPQPTRPLGAVY
jgi:hypothetical protein